jgi:LysR family glycine cleavage system transcriptional activator
VLTPSFDRIDQCLEDIRGASVSADLKVSVEPSFAACWLVPRLPEFRKLHPDVEISLDADPRTIEFRTGQAQIAIRHSATVTAWPRTESRHLVDVRMVPVIASDLLERGPPISSPHDIFAYGLLHEETRDAWSRWFEAAGISMPETARGPVYADDGLVLQAALRGQGVALLDEAFAEEEIRAGRLRQLFDLTVPNGAYWLVARSFDRLAPAAADFARWVTESFHKR